jgi:hypothetical protein
MTTETYYIVIDCAFNQVHNKQQIGEIFLNVPPSYTAVLPITQSDGRVFNAVSVLYVIQQMKGG